MKNAILVSIALAFAAPAFGHDFKSIKSFSDKTMRNTYAAAQKVQKERSKLFQNIGGGTVIAAYEIEKISPKRQKGETQEQLYIRVLKARLHTDYPITGDDGGYRVSRVKSGQEVEASLGDAFTDSTNVPSAPELIDGLKAAADKGLMVLTGDGSGNNTVASFVAVVDVKNQELFYLLDSNFGSDD
jgi:hypothetical protein